MDGAGEKIRVGAGFRGAGDSVCGELLHGRAREQRDSAAVDQECEGGVGGTVLTRGRVDEDISTHVQTVLHGETKLLCGRDDGDLGGETGPADQGDGAGGGQQGPVEDRGEGGKNEERM